MQQQSNMQNKFLIDAEIGDDDVTLPNLPAIDVPIVESPVKQEVKLKKWSRLHLLQNLSNQNLVSLDE